MNELQKWLTLPGNEIWANLDTQKNLPGMNARIYRPGLPLEPVPPAYEQAAPEEERVGRGQSEIPEELPATVMRQWRPPVSFLREQNAGVPIMPWPTIVLTRETSAANAVFRVGIPAGIVLVHVASISTQSGLQGLQAAVLVGKQRFALPAGSTTDGASLKVVGNGANLDDEATNDEGPMVIGTPAFWDVEGIPELWVGAAAIDTVISVAMWRGYGPRV